MGTQFSGLSAPLVVTTAVYNGESSAAVAGCTILAAWRALARAGSHLRVTGTVAEPPADVAGRLARSRGGE